MSLYKVAQLDACIRPLFANPITYVKYIFGASVNIGEENLANSSQFAKFANFSPTKILPRTMYFVYYFIKKRTIILLEYIGCLKQNNMTIATNIFYYFMLALCLMLSVTHYAQNYAGIIAS